jgi:hypothetical protein
MPHSLTLTQVTVVVLSFSRSLSLFLYSKKTLNFTKTTPVADFCEHGYESSGSVKAGTYLTSRISAMYSCPCD